MASRVYRSPRTARSRSAKRRYPLAIVGILILVVGGMTALEVTGVTHIFHRQKPVASHTASQTTKGEGTQSTSNPNAHTAPAGTSSVNPPASGSAQPGDQKNGQSNATNTALLTPTGDFVSAHHVSTSTAISSVCNTSPGVTCQISFSRDGVTKTLQAQTTDRGGSTYWNGWTPNSIGLTAGTWSITATASSNGQTKSAVDALTLVVS